MARLVWHGTQKEAWSSGGVLLACLLLIGLGYDRAALIVFLAWLFVLVESE